MEIEKKLSIYIIFSFIIFIALIFVIVNYTFKSNFKKFEKDFITISKKFYFNEKRADIKKNVDIILKKIDFERINLDLNIKNLLKSDVYKAYNISLHLYNKFNNSISKKELKKIILENIKALSPENRYFFVISSNGVMQLHPKIKKGTNVLNYKDATGSYFVKQYIKIALTRKEGFVNYYWYKLNSKKMYKKLTFVKLFKPYNWIIAMGYYYDDMEKKIKDLILQFIKGINFGENNNEYLFLINLNDKKIIYSSKKLKFLKNKFFVENIINKIKKRKNCFKYCINNEEDNSQIIYAKLYSKWNWIVGSGFFEKRILEKFSNEEIKVKKVINKNLINLFSYFFIVSLIFLIIAIIIAYYIFKKLKYYRIRFQQKELFQKYLINTVPVPLFIKNFKGDYLEVNDEFERFFNIKEEELKKRKKKSDIESEIDLLDKVIEADIFLYNNYKNESIIKRSEIDLINSNGDIRKVVIIKSLFKNIDGEIGGIIGVIIDITKQKDLEEKLMEMSIKDELTKLYNRRYFNEILKIEIERARRYNQNICAIYFDIDHFKKINDTFGHYVGDIVLKELASIIKKNIRKIDHFFRIGGEEFVILLINTSLEDAMTVAEKLRKIVENYEFTIVKKVTISLGVTNLRKSDSPQDFINRADEALYKAKNSGRNRVIVL